MVRIVKDLSALWATKLFLFLTFKTRKGQRDACAPSVAARCRWQKTRWARTSYQPNLINLGVPKVPEDEAPGVVSTGRSARFSIS